MRGVLAAMSGSGLEVRRPQSYPDPLIDLKELEDAVRKAFSLRQASTKTMMEEIKEYGIHWKSGFKVPYI